MTSTPLGGIPGVTATGPAGPSDSAAPAAGDPGAPQSPFAIPEPTPRREHSGRVPSPREVRGHASASIGRDSQGREFSTSTVGSRPEVPSGGNERKTSGPVRFTTPGGRTVLAKEATSDSLVVGPDGNVISNLGSLLASGLIEDTGEGYRMVPDDTSDAGPDDNTPDGDQDGGHQEAHQAPLADQGTEQLVQYLSAEHTSLYDSIVNAVSEPRFDGILSVEKIEDVAHSLGVNTETARATIAQVPMASSNSSLSTSTRVAWTRRR